MKRMLILFMVITLWGTANDCDYYMKMGLAQENIAAQAYQDGDLVKTRKHLRFALSNYMSGFKPCMNTPRDDEHTKSTQRVNSILTDKKFRDAATLQKFFKEK